MVYLIKIDKTKDDTFRSLVYSNLGEAMSELHLLSDKWVKPYNFKNVSGTLMVF